MTTKTKETDWKFIEYCMELLACVCFLEDKTGKFKELDISIDDIDTFCTKVLIEEWSLSEEDPEDVKLFMTIVFTISLVGKSTKITLPYTHDIFLPALIDKAVVPTGAWQSKEFKFNKPNPLKIYDAEFLLEEELGVLIE